MPCRFEVEGQTVSSLTVIDALSVQLMDERIHRLEEVRDTHPDTRSVIQSFMHLSHIASNAKIRCFAAYDPCCLDL